MPLRSIESRRLYRQIADQLRKLIVAGEFPSGERLPAERDLAVQLRVSRPSVREALIALEVEGLVEIRGGSGVYVRASSNGARSNGARPAPDGEWGPLELIRARGLIEGEVAAQAAQLATRKQIAAIEDTLAAMETDAAAGNVPLESDRAFHVAVAEAAGNGVLVELVQRFWDARFGKLFQQLGTHFESARSWQAAIEDHRAVLVAIRKHDAKGARQAMKHHMDKAHARFSISWRRARRAD
jgi:DNA-binding FadR family transcriptional regulator